MIKLPLCHPERSEGSIATSRGVLWSRREVLRLSAEVTPRDSGRQLKTQHRFREHVPLHLRRAAVDRRLALIEVARRHVVDVRAADRHDVAVDVAQLGEGRAVPADRLDRELGDLLTDLGAPHLDDRGHAAWSVAGLEVRVEYQLVHLDGVDLHLERRHLLAPVCVARQWLAAVELAVRELAEMPERLAQARTVRLAAALELEQVLGV